MTDKYDADVAKAKSHASKSTRKPHKVKLYLAIQQWSDGDGYESGDAGANILYATLSKDKMDAYIAEKDKEFRNRDNTYNHNLVTIDLDTDYSDYVDRGTKTEVASWFDEVYDFGDDY